MEEPLEETACPVCKGFGYLETQDGRRVVPCSCRQERMAGALKRAAHIPERYGNCRLKYFNVVPPGNQSLARAKSWAQRFVDEYPAVNCGCLLSGPVGVGKTHLAVAILSELIELKGVKGLFCDFTDLLEKVQGTFGSGDSSADEVLEPCRTADLLVLDELGARRPTDWARDVLYGLLNTRYNRRRLTILTTNFPDAPRRPGDETLEMRVGTAVRSRLFEMSELITMEGEDYRRTVRSARAFA